METEEIWYQEVYSKLKKIGVKTDPIANRIGVSRTALRLWFDNQCLSRQRGKELAVALEDYCQEVRGVAKYLRRGVAGRL